MKAGASIALAALLALSATRTWDFEKDEPGKPPAGFAAAKGEWVVSVVDGNRVVAQKAKNDDDTFNVALVDGSSYRDLDLSVRVKAVAGDNDRGGGVVWRAKDAKNYYIARFNPLEDNFRVYKVEDGKRTLFKDARVKGDDRWHALRVTMSGPRMACYLDDQKLLEVVDSTFAEAGQIGLWSKSDAQSLFDELTVSEG